MPKAMALIMKIIDVIKMRSIIVALSMLAAGAFLIVNTIHASYSDNNTGELLWGKFFIDHGVQVGLALFIVAEVQILYFRLSEGYAEVRNAIDRLHERTMSVRPTEDQ